MESSTQQKIRPPLQPKKISAYFPIKNKIMGKFFNLKPFPRGFRWSFYVQGASYVHSNLCP
jgi:hypothetical protein